MRPLVEELCTVRQGEPSHFQNLTIVPLLREPAPAGEPAYLLLEDAIRTGSARVTEVSSAGTVPELRFENNGDKPVLLLDGEELLGAKQNRVLNLTVLAAAHSITVIPVSCVEAGRWHYRDAEFKPADRVMYAAARAAKLSQVTESLRHSGTRQADQSAVWDEISAKAERMQAESPTHAMAAGFERHAHQVDSFVRAFEWQANQAGALFAIDGRPCGMDLFDHPDTLRHIFAKLVRSYALDAVDTQAPVKSPASGELAGAFLRNLGEAECFAQPGVGLGKDVRIKGRGVSGAALWADERYVHLCAFPADGNGGESAFRTRLSRPRARQR